MTRPVSLYIHVPFCLKKCPYCAFYKKKWDSDEARLFVPKLIEEIQFYRQRFPELRIATVFFGGGTPNLLQAQQVEKIMTALRQWAPLENIEISMEMNPGFRVPHKLKRFYDLGVNRASLGVQSLQADELKILGRNHSPEEAIEAIQVLRDVGFNNLNVDLMFGLPKQKMASLKDSLQQLLRTSPEHLSLYHLTIEPGTPFKANQVMGVTEEEGLKQYLYLRRALSNAGYHHYEVSNFSKPGFECQHNHSYWTWQPYIGLGPGAHSFFNGARYHQAGDLEAYLKNPIPRVFRQKKFPNYSRKNQIEDFILMGLRMTRGVPFSAFIQLFNMDYATQAKDRLDILMSSGLLHRSTKTLKATKKGQLVLDAVVQECVSAII